MAKGKRNNYRFWHSPIFLVIFFIILALFAYNIFDLVQKERETSKKKELILNQIEDLKDRENSLSQNIIKIKTEEGKEEIIREKYQVAKAGEKMVVIIDEEGENKLEQNEQDKHGFWNWIKSIFNK